MSVSPVLLIPVIPVSRVDAGKQNFVCESPKVIDRCNLRKKISTFTMLFGLVCLMYVVNLLMVYVFCRFFIKKFQLLTTKVGDKRKYIPLEDFQNKSSSIISTVLSCEVVKAGIDSINLRF